MAAPGLPAGGRRVTPGRALKEAFLAALVALALAVPLVGLRTVDSNGGLQIETRFGWVGIAVIVVFIGRLLLRIYWSARGDRATGPSTRRPGPRTLRVAGGVGMVIALVLPFLPFSTRYVDDVATKVLVYVMLGWGLNVVVGLAGLLDLGYVAFFAVGAYTYALLSQALALSYWAALPIAGGMSALFGIVLGFPVLRLRGDYLAIVTLGFGEIIRIILLNWGVVTGGPAGISNIPSPTFFGLPFARNAPPGVMTFHRFFHLDFAPIHRVIFLYYVILALALVTSVFTRRLRKLPIGRAWEALREDEIACRALGINPTAVKLSAFAIGAMLAGFAGAFFAGQQTFISPEGFKFLQSAIILAIVVLGGMGSQLGVVLAAIVIVSLPELGREFDQYRMLAFGAAMVAIMVWRPRGLVSHREPSITLDPSAGGRG
jgi:branched-chain amino acid transport system permease protein